MDCVCVAMRGRYTDKGKIKQQLEPNLKDVINTLTTVAKDNLILEVKENAEELYPCELL